MNPPATTVTYPKVDAWIVYNSCQGKVTAIRVAKNGSVHLTFANGPGENVEVRFNKHAWHRATTGSHATCRWST